MSDPAQTATVILLRTPFSLEGSEEFHVAGSPTLREWLDARGIAEFDIPTIAIHQGEPVLRSAWTTTRMEPGTTTFFIGVPGFGALLVGALFGSAFAASVAGLIVAGVINAVISIGLSALANLLLSPPKPPTPHVARDLAAASPTYSIQAQGNSARLGASVPVVYGQLRIYPDFATAPYNEFAGGEQYLYQLYVIGLGEYDILDQRIEDSPFSSFPECEILGVYAPGAAVASLPKAVYTSVEVSDQELLGSYVGHFIVNPAGTDISEIAVDVVAAQGMYYANDAGGLDSRDATFRIEAAAADDLGNLVTGFYTLATHTIAGATVTPIRQSYRHAVDALAPGPGRWAVRLIRTDAKDTSARAGNMIQWTNLRGYTAGTATYPGVTTVATRFRASNNLSEESSRRVNFLIARKLQTWDNVTQLWGAPVATRSIAWALADICRATYGANLPYGRYDLESIHALEQTLAARNARFGAGAEDYCDLVFDNAVTVWEALTTVARLARAMPINQGGVIRFVRDQEQTLHTALFTPRNMVRGQFAVDYLMPSEETADAVTVEYWDREAMRPREVTAFLPGSAADKPAKVKLLGATSAAHAWREGMYMAASNRYRRKVVKFSTELEGHIPMPGDLILVAHDMPVWGVSGDLEAYDAGTRTFTLSEPVAFGAGTHYLAVRKRSGGVSGPWVVMPATPEHPHRVTLAAGQTLDFTPYVGLAEERTHFAFGQADTANNFRSFRVLAPIRYRGGVEVELTAVGEDDRVHTADQGTPPASDDVALLPGLPTQPVVESLSVTQTGTAEAPILNLDWAAAAGATHYLVEISSDNANWSRAADTLTTSARVPVEPGVWWVRVAGEGLALGPWLTIQVTAGVVSPPGVVQGLGAAESFLGTQARIQWTATPRATGYRIEVWAAAVKRRDATVATPAYAYSAEDVARDGGPWRSITFRVWAVSSAGESDGTAELTLSNPQVPALGGVQVYSSTKTLVVTYTRPADTDFAGVRVHLDTTPAVAIDGSRLVYEGGDSVVTIVRKYDGTPTDAGIYYLKIGGYDAFGKDAIDYGVNEYVATIASGNLPSAQEVKNALQAALDDPQQTPLVFRADTFAVELVAGDARPFVVGTVEGQPVVMMDASVYVQGPISADQIVSGAIAATERVEVGGGEIAIDGGGAILVYDGPTPAQGVPDTRDYAILTAGILEFLRYRAGAYQTYKSVKRFESGVAASGSTVVLPGYWDAQPRVIVSPNALESYNAPNGTQSQAWAVRADNLSETGPGSQIWQFDAIAELTFTSSTGGEAPTESSGALSGVNTWNSTQILLPGNVSELTVGVSFKSVRATGSGNNYQSRKVTWTVWGRVKTTPAQWNSLSTKTRTLTAAEHGLLVADSATATFPSSGYYDAYYVNFVAEDASGTYTSGTTQYQEQSSVVATDNGPDRIHGDGSTLSAKTYSVSPTLAGYTPPSGWTVKSVVYAFEYAAMMGRASGVSVTSTVSGTWGLSKSSPAVINGWASKNNGTLDAEFLGASQLPNSDLWPDSSDDWISTTMTTTSYAPTALSMTLSIPLSSNNTFGIIAFRNVAVSVTIQAPLNPSSTSFNEFRNNSYSWATSALTTIASGTLNWLAVGE